jgi:hypothetical protein
MANMKMFWTSFCIFLGSLITWFIYKFVNGVWFDSSGSIFFGGTVVGLLLMVVSAIEDN